MFKGQNHWLLGLVLLVTTSFLTISIVGGQRVHFDDSDGYEYILQGLRVSHPNLYPIPDSWARAKGLVILLSVFNAIFQWFHDSPPSITHYHVLMTFITLSYIIVWSLVIGALFSAQTGVLTSLILFLNPTILQYSFFTMADITTGLYWGGVTLVFWKSIKLLQTKQNTRTLIDHSILLGALGALSAMGKYHFIIAFPLLITVFLSLTIFSLGKLAVGEKFKNHFILSVTSAGICLLTLEGSLRLWGQHMTGVKTLFYWLLDYLPRTTFFATNEPKHFYVYLMSQILGPLMLIIGGLSVTFLFIRMSTEFSRRASPTKITMTQIALCSIFLVNLIILLMTQVGGHKEVRYLLPIIPVLTGFSIEGARCIYSCLSIRTRPIWLVICLISLFQGVLNYCRASKYLLQDPVLVTTEVKEFWSFWKTAEKEMGSCQSLSYEKYFGPKHLLFQGDTSYYQAFGLYSQLVSFHTRIFSPKQKEVKLIESSQMDKNHCYIVSKKSDDNRSFFNGNSKNVAVFWPLTEEQKTNGASLSKKLNASLTCSLGKNADQCFLSRAFF